MLKLGVWISRCKNYQPEGLAKPVKRKSRFEGFDRQTRLKEMIAEVDRAIRDKNTVRVLYPLKHSHSFFYFGLKKIFGDRVTLKRVGKIVFLEVDTG